MRVRFDADAADEFRDAVDYYDGRKAGLGGEFEAEVRKAIDLVVQFPNGWPLVEAGARRIQVNRFPHGLVYLSEQGELYIVAVMHLSRRPGYWARRLTNR